MLLRTMEPQKLSYRTLHHTNRHKTALRYLKFLPAVQKIGTKEILKPLKPLLKIFQNELKIHCKPYRIIYKIIKNNNAKKKISSPPVLIRNGRWQDNR